MIKKAHKIENYSTQTNGIIKERQRILYYENDEVILIEEFYNSDNIRPEYINEKN